MHKNKKRHLYHNDENKFSLSSIMKKCTVLCIGFFIFSIIFAVLLSLFFYNTENPTSKIRLISLFSVYFSSFICGIIISRISREKELVCGIILGMMIFIITFSISLFVRNSQYSVFMHIFLPLSSVIGTLCGKKREKRRHRKKY